MKLITYAAFIDDGNNDLTMEQWAKIMQDIKKVVRDNLAEMFLPPGVKYTESCFPSDVLEVIGDHVDFEEEG